MPVASHQKDRRVVRYRRLPKPSLSHHQHPAHEQHHRVVAEGVDPDGVCLLDESALSEEMCLPHDLWNVESAALNQIIDARTCAEELVARNTQTQQQQCHLISTHSPPIINLSPNLSPPVDHLGSPVYDLRESTRPRTLQGNHHSVMMDILGAVVLERMCYIS